MYSLRRLTTQAWIGNDLFHKMCSEASSMLPLETGGLLIAYWSDEAVTVTNLVGAGPGARHRRRSFVRPGARQHAG